MPGIMLLPPSPAVFYTWVVSAYMGGMCVHVVYIMQHMGGILGCAYMWYTVYIMQHMGGMCVHVVYIMHSCSKCGMPVCNYASSCLFMRAHLQPKPHLPPPPPHTHTHTTAGVARGAGAALPCTHTSCLPCHAPTLPACTSLPALASTSLSLHLLFLIILFVDFLCIC